MEQMKIVISMLLTQFEFYPADPTMVWNNLIHFIYFADAMSNVLHFQREMKYKPGYSLVVAPMSTAVGIRLRQESS